MKIYLVGGAVRDSLLKLPVYERDWVVVGSKPQDLLTQGFIQVGKDFPVFLHPQSKEEYALARTERKSGQGHTGFICDANNKITLEQDLQRRDLTINAIAMDDSNQLIDPFHGIDDLNKRILRHISPAFKDDPLRVLRVARFAARFHHLGFTIAPETLTLMQDIVNQGEMQTLTVERVWKETEKALSTNDPQIFFQTLKQCHALQVLFPELAQLFDITCPQSKIDCGAYALLSLKLSSSLTHERDIRFAALCHNFGEISKDKSPSKIKTVAMQQISNLCLRIKVPNNYKKLSLIACQYYQDLHRINQMTAEELLHLLNGINVWRNPHYLPQLIIVSSVDANVKSNRQHDVYPQGEYLKQAYLVAKSISVTEIIQQGFSGKLIQDELARQRIIALDKWQKTKFDYNSNNRSQNYIYYQKNS